MTAPRRRSSSWSAIHWPANRQIFDSAAFSILLVADLQAIEPLYGGLSRDFCLVEAGAVAQLLQSAAPACGLGLCPIGYLNVERVRPVLHLHDRHEFLHALVGGRLLTDVHGSATGSMATTVPSRTAGATALASAARTEQGP